MSIPHYLKRQIMAIRPDLDSDALERAIDIFCDFDCDPYNEPRVCPLSDFSRNSPFPRSSMDFEYTDFVYFRPWEVVFFNVKGYTSHEIFLSELRGMYHDLCVNHGTVRDYMHTNRDWEKDAEKFLHEGLGFFLSSALGTSAITISEHMTLTFREKKVFEGFRFSKISLGDRVDTGRY